MGSFALMSQAVRKPALKYYPLPSPNLTNDAIQKSWCLHSALLRAVAVP